MLKITPVSSYNTTEWKNRQPIAALQIILIELIRKIQGKPSDSAKSAIWL